jgi:hypothetical protein
MSTIIKYRQFKTGMTALFNVNRAAEIIQRVFDEGVSILVHFPRNVYAEDTRTHSTCVASDLDPKVAELVMQMIAKSVSEKEELVDVADLIRTAEKIAWYSDVCAEEVTA